MEDLKGSYGLYDDDDLINAAYNNYYKNTMIDYDIKSNGTEFLEMFKNLKQVKIKEQQFGGLEIDSLGTTWQQFYDEILECYSNL